MHMGGKHFKNYSASLAIKKMKIKPCGGGAHL